jgi:hypothetical protein
MFFEFPQRLAVAMQGMKSLLVNIIGISRQSSTLAQEAVPHRLLNSPNAQEFLGGTPLVSALVLENTCRIPVEEFPYWQLCLPQNPILPHAIH